MGRRASLHDHEKRRQRREECENIPAANFLAVDRDLTIATYRVDLEEPLREIETKNANILMHRKAPEAWLNGQIIAHYAGAGAVHSIRPLVLWRTVYRFSPPCWANRAGKPRWGRMWGKFSVGDTPTLLKYAK